MTLTTRRIGNYVTTAQSGMGTIAAGNSKAIVYDAAEYDIWIQSVSLYGNSNEASVGSFRAAIYAVDDDNVPAVRLGYTQTVTLTGQMTAPGVGGALHTGAVTYVDAPDGGPFTGIRIQAGQRYAIDIEAISHDLAYSYIPGTRLVYARTAPGNPQPTTFTSYVSSTHGLMTCFATGSQNAAPRVPANLAPDGDVFLDSLVFSADFEDLNGAYGDTSGDGIDNGDVLNQYHIQARLSGILSSLIWDTKYFARSPEWSADQMYRVYGGSVSLAAGDDFEWRARFSDSFGEWSDWSDWTQVYISTAGIVTLDDDPQGTIQSIAPNVYGRWSHTTAEAMTKVRVRILDGVNNRTLYTSGDITKAAVSSALPGTLFEVTWASTGFPDLAWGRTYKYQMSGRDTSGVWSDWSARRQFRTNQAPRVPSTLNPRSSQVYGVYPLLTCRASDNDDTVATNLEVHGLIIRPDLSTVAVEFTYNATTLLWEFQTTGTELTAEGTYFWSAYSWDGTLYSGETTVYADRTDSSVATFQYYAGPTCVMTAPLQGDTITASTILVEWTSTGFTEWEVIVYAAETDTVVYRSGEISEGSTQTSGSHTVPSGYIVNGESYDILINVTSFLGLFGASEVITVTVDYTEPDPLTNVQAVAIALGTDIHETAIRVTWDITIYGDDEDQAFEAYVITRSAASGPDVDQIVLARLTNAAAVAVIDYLPASGIEYTYGVSVIVRTGLDELQSEVTYATTSVTLQETVLALIADPSYARAILANVRERSVGFQNDRTTYVPLSGDKPTTVRALSRYESRPITAAIIDDTVLTAKERRAELEALDAQLGTVCIRFGDGTKRYIDMQGLAITDQHGGYYTATFTGIEQAVTEGTV